MLLCGIKAYPWDETHVKYQRAAVSLPDLVTMVIKHDFTIRGWMASSRRRQRDKGKKDKEKTNI